MKQQLGDMNQEPETVEAKTVEAETVEAETVETKKVEDQGVTQRPVLSVKVVLLTYGVLLLLAVGWGWIRGDMNVFVLDSHLRVWVPAVFVSRLYNMMLWVVCGVLGGVAGGLLVVFAGRVAVKHLEGFRRMQDAFASMLGEMTTAQIFFAAAASSLAEEALFRGAMMPSWGIWISSLVFAVLHAPAERRMLWWPFFAFLMGLGFGGLAMFFGHLWAPISAHFIINLLNLRKISDEAGKMRQLMRDRPGGSPQVSKPPDAAV